MLCPRHENDRNRPPGQLPAQLGWQGVYANRLILSHLDDSTGVANMVAAEIEDCPRCWEEIAWYLASQASENLVEAWGDDEAAAIAITEDHIARLLDIREERKHREP